VQKQVIGSELAAVPRDTLEAACPIACSPRTPRRTGMPARLTAKIRPNPFANIRRLGQPSSSCRIAAR
jgi:hypothetical protein